jgi:hypothetical protein
MKQQYRLTRWLLIFPALILVFALGAPAITQADDPTQPEPPVRLKPKKKKDAPPDKEDKKVDDKKTDDKKAADKKTEEQPKLRPDKKEEKKEGKKNEEPDVPDDDGEAAKETVNRIQKNMRVSEDRLKKKDSGEVTQGVQRDILKDLDKLIEQNKRQQQQQQQQGGGGSSSSRRLQQQKQNGRGQKDQQANSKQSGKDQQQNGGSQKQKGGKDKEGKDKNGKDKEGKDKNGKDKEGKDKGGKDKEGKDKEGKDKNGKDKDKNGEKGKGGGGDSKDPGSKIAELYKDIWGHLPEKMRQEMDTYSREQFMDRYKGLLKQYYSTLSEKGRGKEGD